MMSWAAGLSQSACAKDFKVPLSLKTNSMSVQGCVCLELWHPVVTPAQAKDGEECEEAWQRSGPVGWRLFFWCNEPCGSHWPDADGPAGCIMPILQALQCMLGEASESKGGRAAPQNKASFSLTTPASMKLPTGPSTLDNPLLMLQSLLPLRPLLLMLSQ